MGSYKGITFAKGYDKSFAEFKDEFASTHIFKNIQPKQREAALKEAYKIATHGNTKATTTKSQGTDESEHKQ